MLCHWSSIYDTIFEHPDCPNDEIVHDSKKVDKWLKEQAKKAEAERRKRNAGSKRKSVDQHSEVIYFGPESE